MSNSWTGLCPSLFPNIRSLTPLPKYVQNIKMMGRIKVYVTLCDIIVAQSDKNKSENISDRGGNYVLLSPTSVTLILIIFIMVLLPNLFYILALTSSTIPHWPSRWPFDPGFNPGSQLSCFVLVLQQSFLRKCEFQDFLIFNLFCCLQVWRNLH